MWRRARKRKREDAQREDAEREKTQRKETAAKAAAEDAARNARELEERTASRLRSIDGYDFDEDEAAEVEARLRRMSYGHKVEK